MRYDAFSSDPGPGLAHAILAPRFIQLQDQSRVVVGRFRVHGRYDATRTWRSRVSDGALYAGHPRVSARPEEEQQPRVVSRAEGGLRARCARADAAGDRAAGSRVPIVCAPADGGSEEEL